MAVRRTRDRVVLDPIYGYITVPADLSHLVDAPEVQRLRRVSQTAMASSVYPSIVGTRFEHALGAMHLSMEGWRHAWENSPDVHDNFRDDVNRTLRRKVSAEDFPTYVALALGAVALLHDVGHTPFSHALENFFRDHADILFSNNPDVSEAAMIDAGLAFHEVLGGLLAEKLLQARIHIPAVAELAHEVYDAPTGSLSWAKALNSIVSGEIDCDRIDYLLRDARSAGTEYGAIDFQRLVSGLEIVRGDPEPGAGDVRPYEVVLGHRARSAAEQLLVARSQAYRWVYFHPRVVAADLALARACEMLLAIEDASDQAVRESVGFGFRDIRPDLDFTQPSVPRSLGTLFSQDDQAEIERVRPAASLPLELEESDRSAVEVTLSGVLGVGGDDGRIFEWLKQAYVLAAVLQPRTGALKAAAPTLADDLMRVRRYIDVILTRAKVFMPAWKNYEEYYAVASRMKVTGHLLKAIENSYESLINGQSDRAGRDTAVELRDQTLSLAHGREEVPVQLLNWIAGKLLRNSVSPLAAYLDAKAPTPIVGAVGFWDGVFREFAPLKTGRQATSLVKDKEVISLRKTSPLVSALKNVDEERIKLFVYFFVQDSSQIASLDPSEARTHLQEQFIRQFPGFVLANLENVEKELVAMRTGER